MEHLQLALPEDEQQKAEIIAIIDKLQLWNISTPQHSQKFQNILPYVSKMFVPGLYISVIGFPLYKLCQPTFTLTTLNLDGCQLTTIQCISRMQMPNLITLDLSNNRITTCRSLRKATFPALTTLRLQQNPVTDFHWLSELRSNSQFFSLFVEEFYSKSTAEDLTPIVKLQPTIRKLYCEAQGRLSRSSFWRGIIKMRAQNLKIYKYCSYGAM